MKQVPEIWNWELYLNSLILDVLNLIFLISILYVNIQHILHNVFM